MGLMSVNDYKNFLKSLFPRGAAWKLNEDSDIKKLSDSFATELERVDSRALQLIEEIDPRTTTELLTNYEKLLGLPEEGLTLSTTTESRRGDIVAKLTAYGGQSLQYIQDIADKLGITIVSLTEYTECLCGLAQCGDVLSNGFWKYSIKIVLPVLSEEDEIRFKTTIEKIKPAHTLVFYETA